MPILEILPHGGIDKRFPEHKISGKKLQKVRDLINLTSLDGEISLFKGSSRYDSTPKSGTCLWAKRIYYQDGGDNKKFQFTILGNKMYRGDDSTSTLTQVLVSESFDTQFETDIYQIDATLKISGTVTTFLVDGKYFYKFTGNAAGSWDRLPIKTDLDGNTVEPVFIAEYLDRLWVLSKNRNVLIGSKNLDPENLNDATDSILIELPPGNGGFPQALAVHPNGYLYIIHEDYFAPLSGSSPSTFGVKPGDITKGYGTRAPRSALVLDDTIGFLDSKTNEYYLMNDLKTPLSYDIRLSRLVNPVKIDSVVATLDTNLNCIRIAYWPTGGVRIGDEEIYSLTEEKWCGETRDRNISCYSQWNGKGDDGRMITGRSDTGLLMVEDESLNTGAVIAKNGSQLFFDSGVNKHTITANGNVQLSNTQKRFGVFSGLFDGTGDYLTIPDSSDFDLSGGIWTVDCWIYPSVLAAGAYMIFGQRTDANNYMLFAVQSTGQLQFQVVSAASPIVAVTTAVGAVATGNWYHVAIQENGDTYKIFVNGVDVTNAGGTDAQRPANYTDVFYVGNEINNNTPFNGYIDEFRLSKGVARYGASYSNPSGQYAADEYTKLLIHFEGYEGDPIHYKFTTASYLVEEVGEAQFEEFFIDARPLATFQIPFYYYVDSRITTVGSENVSMQGEFIGLGLIEIADQNVFLNRILPLIDRSKGRMIRFQIEEYAVTKRIGFFGIYAKYNVQETRFSKFIPGRA